MSFDFQQQDQAGQGRLFDRQFTEERLGVRNTITFTDVRFATLNFGLTLGFQQTEFAALGGQEDSGNGRVAGFDLAATVLPLKPYGFTLLASTVEDVTPVEFAGSRTMRTSSLGLSLGLGPRAFPGTLRYRGTDFKSTSELGQTVRGVDQSRRSLTYTGENRWSRQELYTFVDFLDLEDRVAGSFSSRSLTASLSHQAELLAPNLATLRTTLRHFDRKGDLVSSSFLLDEELRLRHTDNLSSGLRYELRNLGDFSGGDSESRRGTAWVHHRLFESLESEFRLSRESVTSEAGRSDLDGARLEFDYRKNLPRRGKLRGRLVTAWERRDSLRGDSEELIARERHTARFGVPSRLDRPRVVPGSVVVTDELEQMIFEEGVDYELRAIGEFTELLPLPGGSLQDGDVVLVDYRAEAPVMTEFASLTTNLDLTIDYGWVAPFLSYRATDDRRLSGQVSSLQEDREDRVAGVRFRANSLRLRFLSFNEWRSRDSGLLAYHSLRLADSLSYTPRLRWTLGASAVHINTDYDLSPRQVRIDDGKLSVRWRPLRTLSLESYGSRRITRDTEAADQIFSRVGFEARWNLGKITLISSIERWQRDRDGDELDGLRASFKVSRRFFPGHLAAPRRRTPQQPWPEDLPGLAFPPTAGGGGRDEGEPADVEDGEILDLPAEVETGTDDPPEAARDAEEAS